MSFNKSIWTVGPMSNAQAVHEPMQTLRSLEGEIVALLQALVRVDTVAIPPKGCETEGQNVLRAFLRKLGIDAELYDLEFLNQSNHPYVRHERNYSGRHNLIARLHGNGGGSSLMFSGHMDTVPPGYDKWQESPWSGSIHEGKLYGRGSYDMKGGLVAAFAVMVALKKSGVRLNGDLFCESVVDEEWAGGGGTLAARIRGDLADACVIPEPTDLAIFRASRGGHFVDIEVRAGDPQNYFSKDEVVSPAIPLGRLLGWIDDWVGRRKRIDKGELYKSFTDPAPVQVLAVEANSFDEHIPWSVPLMGRIRLYFQFLPHEDVTAVIGEIEESFRAFCVADSFFSKFPPEWRAIVDPPLIGHELESDHQLTQVLSGAFSRVLDQAPVVTGAEFPCDAFLNQRYFGMPTLVFGPRGAGAHNADEFVEIDSVMKTAEVLMAAALEWCGTS